MTARTSRFLPVTSILPIGRRLLQNYTKIGMSNDLPDNMSTLDWTNFRASNEDVRDDVFSPCVEKTMQAAVH